jgi:dTDP-4-amino-4,6-dideoxygalactose transaminase
LLPAALASLRSRQDTAIDLETVLAERFGVGRIDLCSSGREALRVALMELARRTHREEVVVPAYTCFSVPSAVVAAGLRVRLVDVTPAGWIDSDALAALPLDRAAAIVACNLFGVAEPISAVRSLARDAGAAVIDDAAQAFGARDHEGPVGGRAEVGVLSFGRGKPLACLGGGAILWKTPPRREATSAIRPSRWTALSGALVHDLVLSPYVFPWVAALPWLHVGQSRFEPDFPHGEIPGSSLALALGALPGYDSVVAERAERAEPLIAQLERRTGFRPLTPRLGERAAYPRLALIAPSPGARDRALRALVQLGAGASGLYPTALDEVVELLRHRTDTGEFPRARDLAARLLTIPSHPRFTSTLQEQVVDLLAEI